MAVLDESRNFVDLLIRKVASSPPLVDSRHGYAIFAKVTPDAPLTDLVLNDNVVSIEEFIADGISKLIISIVFGLLPFIDLLLNKGLLLGIVQFLRRQGLHVTPRTHIPGHGTLRINVVAEVTADRPLAKLIVDEDVQLSCEIITDFIGRGEISLRAASLPLFKGLHDLLFITIVLEGMRRLGISGTLSSHASASIPITDGLKRNAIGTPLFESIVHIDTILNQLGLNSIGRVEVPRKLGLQSFSQEGMNLVILQSGRVFTGIRRWVVVMTKGSKVNRRTPSTTASPSSISAAAATSTTAAAAASISTIQAAPSGAASGPPRTFAIVHADRIFREKLISDLVGSIVVALALVLSPLIEQSLNGGNVHVGRVAGGVALVRSVVVAASSAASSATSSASVSTAAASIAIRSLTKATGRSIVARVIPATTTSSTAAARLLWLAVQFRKPIIAVIGHEELGRQQRSV
mmetsp:Transcript_9774/g.27383  ORF Transcript_9774/g.27383 Transcript_9774/m.27383 type:complete len:463 (-) Transcript_9774:135-1523(-)